MYSFAFFIVLKMIGESSGIVKVTVASIAFDLYHGEGRCAKVRQIAVKFIQSIYYLIFGWYINCVLCSDIMQETALFFKKICGCNICNCQNACVTIFERYSWHIFFLNAYLCTSKFSRQEFALLVCTNIVHTNST